MRYFDRSRARLRAACHALRSSALALCLIIPSLTADGQQDCRTPTVAAERSVWVYLNSESSAQWRESLGITATTVAELTPLTDPGDAVLCRRMDSTFAPRPAWYYRTGRYIIGTDYGSPPPARSEFAPFAFVFDSLGQRLTQTASALAPADLHLVSAQAGQVELAWSNRTTSIDSYQLQRAVGSGAFADIGSPLAGSATSAADASTSNGNTYRYRLVAFRAGLLSDYSTPVSVTLSDLGTVSRLTTGLLFRDDFNRANGSPGSDWVAEAGTWTITNNALQVVAGQYANSYLRLAALTNRKDFHVQVLISRAYLGTYSTVLLRRVGGTYYMGDLGSSNEGNKPRMHRWLNGGYAGLGYGTFGSTVNTAHRLTFSVIGSSQKLWANGLLQVTASDATPANDIDGGLTLNVYGLGGDGTTRFDDAIVNSSRTVSVAGLAAGYRVRVAGLVSSPSTGTGDVTLDLQGTQLPAARIEILNRFDVLVKTFTPTDGVWGGDRYSLNGAP